MRQGAAASEERPQKWEPRHCSMERQVILQIMDCRRLRTQAASHLRLDCANMHALRVKSCMYTRAGPRVCTRARARTHTKHTKTHAHIQASVSIRLCLQVKAATRSGGLEGGSVQGGSLQGLCEQELQQLVLAQVGKAMVVLVPVVGCNITLWCGPEPPLR